MTITFEDYLALPGVNISSLLHMAKSPAHYRHVIGGGAKPDTAALRMGRMAHAAVLEPERYAEEVAIWTGGRRAGKEYDAWCLENVGRIQIKEDEHELCMALSAAVREHPVAGAYLASQDGIAEASLQWRHAIGLDCKGRFDWLDVGAGVVVDLKTARDASDLEFGKAAARLDYCARAAFYSDGYAAKFGELPRFVLIAVEKVPPYAVAVYRVGEDLIEMGRRKYEKLLGELALCLERNEWPGLCHDQETDLLLPPWALMGDDGLDLDVGGETLRV
jgi:hypothetical protein